MEFKDYYQILGVDPDADSKAIKLAYRKLARKYHPDVSEQHDAEARFKEVAEAYEVLKDPSRRAEYDELRKYGQEGQEFRPPPGWRSASSSGDQTGFDGDFEMRGPDIEVEMPIFLEDTISEESKSVSYTVPTVDTGGRVTHTRKTLNVKIPRGVAEGQRIRLKGQGAPGHGAGANGDLYLHIRLVPHPLFDVEGHNLVITVPVTPWEAALGAKVEVPTLDGKINLTIPANSQTGQRLRIRNRGLATRDGRGDLLAVLKITIPAHCDDKTRRLWQQLAEQAGFDPRSEWRK